VDIKDLTFATYRIGDTFTQDGDKYKVVALGIDGLYAVDPDYPEGDPCRFLDYELPVNKTDRSGLAKMTKAQLIDMIVESADD